MACANPFFSGRTLWGECQHLNPSEVDNFLRDYREERLVTRYKIGSRIIACSRGDGHVDLVDESEPNDAFFNELRDGYQINYDCSSLPSERALSERSDDTPMLYPGDSIDEIVEELKHELWYRQRYDPEYKAEAARIRTEKNTLRMARNRRKAG